MDNKTIFVAKAEREIAELIDLVLSRDGYNVITVSDERGYDAFIEESLRRYEQEKDRVDLIINGFNVDDCFRYYASFCRINPACKMIILTAREGCIDQVRQNPLEYERIVDCIQLPFDPKTLRATIKRALKS